MGYRFVNQKGQFSLTNPELNSYMYFPLCNDAGLKSAITPELAGDLKMDQNTFALQPTSSEELHQSRATRNFWVKINDQDLWSLTGVSAKQQAEKHLKTKETTHLEAGFLYHKMTRISDQLGLKADITSFVPSNNNPIELTQFRLENTSQDTLKLQPTAAIPLYGRSADNYRDHRHVTSLLSKAFSTQDGMWVKPTLSFDERGHGVNETVYGVFAHGQIEGHNDLSIKGIIPTVEAFIGEGGSLDWPLALFNREAVMKPLGTPVEGYEMLSGFCFENVALQPGQAITFTLGIFVLKPDHHALLASNMPQTMSQWVLKYGQPLKFEDQLQATKKHWEEKVGVIAIDTKNQPFDLWMKWVNIQPILRRIYGCSFLPHHDYGRGGRGWRDLWQDCLALLLMEPSDVRYLLLNNFAGVRVDGSNATIIGDKAGEFIADRNNISRTWMDHGAWPWLTTKEYIHQSGDIGFLFEKQSYFKDALVHRATAIDDTWHEAQGNKLLTQEGSVYMGTIIEHLLVQNLSVFYHVGDHNILRLEDADWNDALDMASEKGESVAFTALYASNLRDLSEVLKHLEKQEGIETIEIAKEVAPLFDPIDPNDIKAKQKHLESYLKAVSQRLSGQTLMMPIASICERLDEKVTWMTDHLQKQEFISNNEGYQWFNSYYDNHGHRVEGDHDLGMRMMLTGQVFTLMGHIATDAQAKEVVKTCRHYLQDETVGGYRLNTNFNEVKSDLGRAFGFAYGHKENGAMFSHMAIMYGNALYKRGFVEEGHELVDKLFNHCYDFDQSRIYPSIPEYINQGGRGMYTYLTGSASWLLYTVVTEMFGCKGHFGDLLLAPKLHPNQFKEGQASIQFLFDEKPLQVLYEMADHETGAVNTYQIDTVTSGQEVLEPTVIETGVLIARETVKAIQNHSGVLRVTLRGSHETTSTYKKR